MSARRIVNVDPRGLRFTAAISSVVLALAIVLGPPFGLVLLAAQTLVFAFGAVLGLQFQPYAVLFRTLVAPRLSAPAALEPEQPARFAQAMGMLISVIALLAGIVGASVVFYVFAGAALAAAFLNAAFNYCLGCDLFLRFGHISRHADLTERRRVERDVTVG
ncbi:MAG: hypothetical protein QG597_3587 [Actinomycetota bacterium]|nr:hypothetical protein [Actinomycetota bacterium]